ncbi:hypothetical protein [Pseudomonas monteilii]|uniref:hypothetical protein n=1 Tax=Pseudomonas monteilii TaxID=76759 RepID=UPI001FD42A56|nr:hypothetical protein [Pseudomonas monteilii]MCJ7852999.1 hypothetical protein [Pseudomonas monteilii]
MALPFTPFPIFAPYEHWKPAISLSVPQNRDVRIRLDQIDPACKAYTSVMYCSKFLEHSASNWSPANAKYHYTRVCHCLELMLNWSFFKGISLLAWEISDFREFLEFQCNPPIDWCGSVVHLKYLPSNRMEFVDWPINERWRILRRSTENLHDGSSGGKGSAKIVQEVLSRNGKLAKNFFSFYLAETGISKTNCAEESPRDILGSLKKRNPLISFTPGELDWAFNQIMSGSVSESRSEQILLFMAIARYTTVTIGHAHSLSQFRRTSDGGWVFDSGRHSRPPLSLSVEFYAYLERYLNWYQIDVSDALPSVPMFPTKEGTFSYSPDGLYKYMENFSEQISVMAGSDPDPAIVKAAAKFKRLTFASIRRSSKI